jgi:hypothetical protein
LFSHLKFQRHSWKSRRENEAKNFNFIKNKSRFLLCFLWKQKQFYASLDKFTFQDFCQLLLFLNFVFYISSSSCNTKSQQKIFWVRVKKKKVNLIFTENRRFLSRESFCFEYFMMVIVGWYWGVFEKNFRVFLKIKTVLYNLFSQWGSKKFKTPKISLIFCPTYKTLKF